MKSIERQENGLYIACFPYFTLGTIRHAVADCLQNRWLILPVKGDSKAADLYRQKLEGFGIDARSVSNGSAAVAVPGRQVEELVEYGVGKLRQNMAGMNWGPEDFDREWLDARRVTGIKKSGSSWKVSADTLAAPGKMSELHDRYGTSTAFVHDDDGSWTVLYTYDEDTLLCIAGELANLAQWMEAALKLAARKRDTSVPDLLAGISGIVSDERVWHGFPCFSKTRVPVHLVYEFLKAGLTADEILKRMPYIRRSDLAAAGNLVFGLKKELKALPRGLEEKLESLA